MGAKQPLPPRPPSHTKGTSKGKEPAVPPPISITHPPPVPTPCPQLPLQPYYLPDKPFTPTAWHSWRDNPPGGTPAPPSATNPHRATPPPHSPATQARVAVLHGALTKYKPGQMRRWVEEDSQGSIQILGIRWLVQEHRGAEELASLLVIYVKESINLNSGVRMGRRLYCTTRYDWDR